MGAQAIKVECNAIGSGHVLQVAYESDRWYLDGRDEV